MKSKWLNHFVELIIVIVGVSIAFWLNEVSSRRKEKEVRSSYLSEIKSDLKTDVTRLNNAIKFNNEKVERVSRAIPLFSNPDENKVAIIEEAVQIGNYLFFTPVDFTYQSMMASGDFKLIGESTIKRNLIALHAEYAEIDKLQNNYMQAMDDNYFPYLIDNFDYITFTPNNPELHRSKVLRNYFMYAINDLGAHIAYYERAKSRALRLDSLIAIELNIVPEADPTKKGE